MRLLLAFLTLTALSGGGWYAWEHVAHLRNFIQEKIDNGEFRTLEIRYTAEEIMEKRRKEFLKNSGYSFLEPKLLFYPYLLMDVKYTKDHASTGEGVLLWSLNDGEMVLNTSQWETTHGFEDCILAKADRHDLKILQSLAENGGASDRERLYTKFQVDPEILDNWLETCRIKKLIVVCGNRFRLHLNHPRLNAEPITRLDQDLVTQPARYSMKMKKRYSPAQIRKLTEIAFGKEFAIRKSQEVFLPVYRIAVQNPDGSHLITYWNALTGLPLKKE